jgi:hypothetical protein
MVESSRPGIIPNTAVEDAFIRQYGMDDYINFADKLREYLVEEMKAVTYEDKKNKTGEKPTPSALMADKIMNYLKNPTKGLLPRGSFDTINIDF